MATFTTNFNLRKPATSDFISVANDLNANWDIVDTEIKQAQDETAALDTRLTTLEGFFPDIAVKMTKKFIVYKSADESVTSSTTLQNDDHLTFTMAAVKVYRMQIVLEVDGDTAGDIKINVTAPSGAGGRFRGQGANSGTTALGNTSMNLATRVISGTTLDSDLVYGVDAPEGTIIIDALVESGVTGGTFTLRWAQNASNATATRVFQHSYIAVEEYTP